MAIFQRKKIDAYTTLSIWKLEESLDFLRKKILLSEACIERLSRLKTLEHKKQFLSSRIMLMDQGIASSDLLYLSSGQVVTKKGFISISHSKEMVAVVFSKEKKVGIDIQKMDSKIFRSIKRVCDKELNYLDKENLKEHAVVWSAKESAYKLLGGEIKNFKKDIFVKSFFLKNKSNIDIEIKGTIIKGYYKFISDYILFYITL